MPLNNLSSQARHKPSKHSIKSELGFVLTTFGPPAAGFDPMTADQQTLRDQGYPDRPTDPAALAHWKALLGTPLRRIVPTITQRKDRRPTTITNGSVTSATWSGTAFATTSSPSLFTVAARWTVPHVKPFANGDDRHMVAWIGIDGFTNQRLFQSGIHAVMSSGDDKPELYAWIEWLPDSEQQIGLPVATGDTMSCLISRDQECLSGDTVQHGQWSSIDDDHRLIPMKDGRILDWKPDDGTWRLWNYDAAQANILVGPHSKGQWQSIRDGHVLVPMHDGNVLDWVPATCDWVLWHYVPGNTQDCLPGKAISSGNWASIRSGHVLVPMKDGNVLDWVPHTGGWRLWKYVPTSLSDCLPGEPVGAGTWSTIVDKHHLVAMDDGNVLDWVDDGSWRIWHYDAASHTDCLPGDAIAVGQWQAIDDDHTLVVMVDGRVLDWQTDGAWRLFGYDAQGRSASQGTVVLRNETQRVETHHQMSAPDGGKLQGKSVEWIVERNSFTDGSVATLADYGKLEFTLAHGGRIGGALVKPSQGENIEMIENGKVVSQGTASGETVTCKFI